MIKPLREVMEFKSRGVLERFLKLHAIPREEAITLFEDLKRYLWLSALMNEKRRQDPNTPDVVIWDGMAAIDEMWHSFILHTNMYIDFCQHYFGEYLHHPPPLPKFEKNRLLHDEAHCNEILVSEMIEMVYDNLGEEIAVRWFDTYQKYSNLAAVH